MSDLSPCGIENLFKNCYVYIYCLINEQECFIPDKTRTASLLNGFKNEPFRKFIDVKILKIDLV